MFSLTDIASVSKLDRIFLKAFLLYRLHAFLSELLKGKIQSELTESNHLSMECYAMDTKITQLIIREILESEQYTLEGIAQYTRIPLDVIVDAACGNNCQISITPWIRIVNLYMEVKPEISEKLCEKLLCLRQENQVMKKLLLNE